MKLNTWGASDTGQTRQVNEDHFVLSPDIGLVLVADGMGGFQRGDVASQLACNVVKETVQSHRHVIDLFRRNPTDAARAAVKAMLETALQKACEQVHDAAVAITGEGGRMGTTMDALLVVGTTGFIAHVGDGRIYLLRGHEAHQLTEDHSLVQQQLRDGVITAEQARRARFKNVITRALGVFPSVLVDSLHFELDRGDRLLMCSDGLYRYIGLREMGFSLMGDVSDETVAKLIALANQRGGRDNITAVLCSADPEPDEGSLAPTKQRMEVLRRVDLFQYCTYRELMSVVQVAEQRSVPTDTVLFHEGDIGRECFIIESGAVAIEKSGTRLATLTSSHYFGEMSFIDTPRRSAAAVTIAPTDFLVINRDRFLQLMKQDSDLGAKLMWQMLQKLSKTVRLTNDKLVAETITLDEVADDLEETG